MKNHIQILVNGMKIKYRADSEKVAIGRLSFLFGDKPGVVTWGSSQTEEDDTLGTKDTYIMICGSVTCEGHSITAEMAEAAVVTGGLWFGAAGKPYDGDLEILSVEFTGYMSCPIKVRGKE